MKTEFKKGDIVFIAKNEQWRIMNERLGIIQNVNHENSIRVDYFGELDEGWSHGEYPEHLLRKATPVEIAKLKCEGLI